MSALRAALARCLRSLPASSDADLLAAYASRRDEDAFRALVERHGPMVLRVCARSLDAAAAEDAFQATFLTLARRAGSLRRPERLAGWLFGTARRVARNALVARQRRQRAEAKSRRPPPAEPFAVLTARELFAALDDAVAALPERYRLPLLLVHWQGLSHQEAARRLGWSPGSVKGRLERGRRTLADSLRRRGVGPEALLALPAARVPGDLLASTAALASGRLAASAAVLALAAGPSKLLPAALVAVLFVGSGILLLGGGPTPADPPAQPPATAKTDAPGEPLPPGALARLGTTRLRHLALFGSGTYYAFRPDSRAVATWNEVSVRLWDLTDGRRLWQFDTETSVSGIAFAPDGKTFAVSSGAGTLLVDAGTGRLIRKLSDDKDRRALVFSRDGRTLAGINGSFEHPAMQLWDVTGQRPPVELPVDSFIQGLAFSRDGSTVSAAAVTRTRDRKVRVQTWDVATRARRPDYDPDVSTHNLALSDDARLLATRDPNPNSLTVQIWDVSAGKYVGKLASGVSQFGFSPDGKVAHTLSFGKGHEGHRVAFWGASTCKLLREIRLPRRTGTDVKFSPDGKLFGSVVLGTMLFLWDAETGQRRLDFASHDGPVSGLAFTAGGTRLASSGNGIRVWDADRYQPVTALESDAWSPPAVLAGARELFGTRRGMPGRFDVATGRPIGEPFAAPEPPNAKVTDGFRTNQLALAPDGRTVVGVGQTTVERPQHLENLVQVVVWDAATGRPTAAHALPSASPLIDPSPDGRAVFVTETVTLGRTGAEAKADPKSKAGASDGPTESYAVVRAVDAATLRTLASVRHPDHFTWRLGVSHDGQTFATVTARYAAGPNAPPLGLDLCLWELRTGRERLTVPLTSKPSHSDPMALALSPDGRLAAVARADSRVQVLDAATGRELVAYGFDVYANALAFRGDNRRLATGHADGTILLWDVPALPPLPVAASLEAAWADLASDDAKRAYAASWALTASPAAAVKLFAERLKPAGADVVERTLTRIAEVAGNSFRTRDATRELATLAEDAEAVLRDALKGNPPAELRTRLQRILEPPAVVRSPELLRTLRAVEALERIGTPEAAAVLRTLAAGPPALRSTRTAKDAFDRLARR